MEPVDTPIFSHQQPPRVGVLVTNLGTPAAPTAAALKPYLKQFLSDRRVVDLPRLLWWPILNFIILNVRPKKSAEAYSEVWLPEGSPLIVTSQHQADALQKQLEDIPVELAMRYRKPSVVEALEKLRARGTDQIAPDKGRM